MSSNDERGLKQANSVRFRWHEFAIADPKIRASGYATALAGYIMHEFDPRKGYAEVSAGGVARAWQVKRRPVERAFALLIKRGWIQVFEAYRPGRLGWSANRYSLAFGPEDYDPQLHTSRHVEGDVDGDGTATGDGSSDGR